MKRVRASTLLRRLAESLGLGELARRTGYAKSTVERAARSGKLSAPLREEVRAVEERRVQARARVRAREQKKTRIPPELETDPRKLAEATGVSERTAKKWIKKGGAPPRAIDAALQLADTGRAYPEPKAGRRESLPEKKVRKLERAMRAFVEATRDGGADREKIQRTYRAWRRAKLPARRSMTKKAWAAFVSRMARELDLPETGVFSVFRFVKS